MSIERLPRRPDRTAGGAGRTGRPDRSRGLSVLVVDDSEDTAQSNAELLTLYGHAVRTAGCGADAVRAVAAEVPDVVLLDIGLPDMSGWEAARRLRARAVGKQPLVVAVTGRATSADRERSADAGIDLHLVKPAAPAALTDLLTWVALNLAERESAGTLDYLVTRH